VHRATILLGYDIPDGFRGMLFYACIYLSLEVLQYAETGHPDDQDGIVMSSSMLNRYDAIAAIILLVSHSTFMYTELMMEMSRYKSIMTFSKPTKNVPAELSLHRHLPLGLVIYVCVGFQILRQHYDFNPNSGHSNSYTMCFFVLTSFTLGGAILLFYRVFVYSINYYSRHLESIKTHFDSSPVIALTTQSRIRGAVLSESRMPYSSDTGKTTPLSPVFFFLWGVWSIFIILSIGGPQSYTVTHSLSGAPIITSSEDRIVSTTLAWSVALFFPLLASFSIARPHLKSKTK
jgi:hypothetical protein